MRCDMIQTVKKILSRTLIKDRNYENPLSWSEGKPAGPLERFNICFLCIAFRFVTDKETTLGEKYSFRFINSKQLNFCINFSTE